MKSNPSPIRGRRILGVDPGTRAVGYGVVDVCVEENHALHYVECGVITVPSLDSHAQRLSIIAATLGEVIAEFEPSTLAMENAFYGKNAASALKLGQARGAIMLLATQHGLSVFEYAPTKIKRTICGHGRATKHHVQERVQFLFKLRHPPASDAADALATAVCHCRVNPLHCSGVITSTFEKLNASSRSPSR